MAEGYSVVQFIDQLHSRVVDDDREAWLPDGYSQIFYIVFGPLSFRTMALLHYAEKFDPFLSLECIPTPSTLAQSKERKGSNLAIWQPCSGEGMLSDRQKSAVCETLAVNEFRLLDGASEYLQLVDLCAVLMKTIADGA